MRMKDSLPVSAKMMGCYGVLNRVVGRTGSWV